MIKCGRKVKRTPGEILDSYVPELPTKAGARAFRLLLRLVSIGKKPRFRYLFDVSELKGRPVMLLADHASTDSYIYALLAWPYSQPNVVMGYHNVLRKGLFRLFMKVGVIPKRLYTPDVSAVRSMLRLKKAGASFMLFPEGIQSMAGSTMPTDPAAMGLVKKLGLPTVLCRGYGAYLNRPRFDSSYRRGPMEFTCELLFTEDELREKTEDELYEKYLSRFRYNDLAWNREKKFAYRGKHANAYGLDKILFVCPACGRRFSMRVEGSDIVCSCGNRVRMDETYALVPVEGSALPFKGVDEWFSYQRAVVRGDIEKEDFSLTYPAEYRTLDLEKLGNDRTVHLGEGRVTVDREAFTFEGTVNGEAKTLRFPISLIPSAPFVSGTGNEFFIGKDYYRFIPKPDPRLSVYILLVIEELHNLTDPARRKVSEDVYGKEVVYGR